MAIELRDFPEALDIPLSRWVSSALDWTIDNGGWAFDWISGVLRTVLINIEGATVGAPWPLVVLVAAALAGWAGGWRLAGWAAGGLVFVGSVGMWKLAMETLALVGTATIISVAVGVPVGILCARSDRVNAVVRPLLDLMQTMPSFVYLVPALMLFGLGRVPALIATIAYAAPPAIRLTNHGLRQVPRETVEAAEAFGATRRQALTKVQLPLAFPTIMAGVNQTIMMALSMVVIASMIGAGGLGREVLEGLSRLDVGRAFTGGIGIVVLAVLMDRIAAAAARPARERRGGALQRNENPVRHTSRLGGLARLAAGQLTGILTAAATGVAALWNRGNGGRGTPAPVAPTSAERSGGIRISGLWKVYGRDAERAVEMVRSGVPVETVRRRTGSTVALQNIDLEIPPGEIFVIMGLSGSGKSTLVRCLNSLIEPTAGQVHLDGDSITRLGQDELRELRRRRMSMVFQSFALLPHRTVEANVAFGLELLGADRRIRSEDAHKAIEQVGLAGWSDAYPDQLSGGMKQRVGLARALAGGADILLMDEPFSALDPLIRTQMQDELLTLQSRVGKTIIFITHDLDEALKLGSRIAILNGGKLAQVGTPEELLRHPADEYVRSFVEKVDRSPILRAKDVMFMPADLIRPHHQPQVALRLMEQEGRSSSFVLTEGGRLAGIVSADDAARAALAGDSDVSGVVKPVEDSCTPETPIGELVERATTQPRPIAVLEGDRLVGVVARVSLVRALSTQLPSDRL